MPVCPICPATPGPVTPSPVTPSPVTPVPAGDRPAPAPIRAPLTPAAYLALRRKAAGYTIERLAGALVMVGFHDRQRPTLREARALHIRMRDQVALMERRGALIRHRDTLALIEAVLPFDPAVYRQLAEAPADRHPRICRQCGCSAQDPCLADGQVCEWVTPDACSHCVAHAADIVPVAA